MAKIKIPGLKPAKTFTAPAAAAPEAADRARLLGLQLRLREVIARAERTGRFEHEVAVELKGITEELVKGEGR